MAMYLAMDVLSKGSANRPCRSSNVAVYIGLYARCPCAYTSHLSDFWPTKRGTVFRAADEPLHGVYSPFLAFSPLLLHSNSSLATSLDIHLFSDDFLLAFALSANKCMDLVLHRLGVRRCKPLASYTYE